MGSYRQRQLPSSPSSVTELLWLLVLRWQAQGKDRDEYIERLLRDPIMSLANLTSRTVKYATYEYCTGKSLQLCSQSTIVSRSMPALSTLNSDFEQHIFRLTRVGLTDNPAGQVFEAQPNSTKSSRTVTTDTGMYLQSTCGVQSKVIRYCRVASTGSRSINLSTSGLPTCDA